MSDERKRDDDEAASAFVKVFASQIPGSFDFHEGTECFLGGLRLCRETEVKELQEKLDLLKNCAQQYGESVEIIEEQLRVAVEALEENSKFHHCGYSCKPECRWHTCVALKKLKGGL